MRARWKASYYFFEYVFKDNKPKIYSSVTNYAPPSALGKRIFVYCGNKTVSLLVRDYMINKPLSNFINTKIGGREIHFRNKKRNKKKSKLI